MRVFDLERLRKWFSPGYIRYSLSVRSRRSPLFIFFMVFVLIGVATLLGMSAYFFGLFDPDSLRAEGISGEYDSGFLDTLLWSLKHILDPGAWSEDYSAPLMITLIGLVNTITGLIIVGILIGFVVNFIQNAMDELKRGSIDVHESGHFLILGWNRKVLSILTFLEELNKKQSVVLLSNADIDLVSEEVRHVERNFRNVTVIPQHGSPTLAAELERVAIRESSSVVLLADEVDESSDQSNDIPTIKSLMQLDNVSWYGKRPNIVVEVANKENLDMVELASGASVPVVSSADFVSKTLVQCARYQGYAEVYSTIFAFEDNEIQIRKMEGIEGKLFGELAEQLESAILLGVSWTEIKNGVERRVAVLNPEPDYDLVEDEELIVLGETMSELLEYRHEDVQELVEFEAKAYERPKLSKALILGWNDNIYQTLLEFDGHAVNEIEITIVSGHEEEYYASYLAARSEGDAFRNISVSYIQADTASQEILKGLDVVNKDVVVLLADESHAAYDPDSRTALTLLILRQIKADSEGDFPKVVAEFYDQDTQALCVETPLTDAVISPEFVSMQLTHLAREPVLASIYRELLSAGGIEIALRPAECYVPLGEELAFLRVIQATQSENEIALGVRLVQSDEPMLNPTNSTRFTFREGDLVVVLAQQVYS